MAAVNETTILALAAAILFAAAGIFDAHGLRGATVRQALVVSYASSVAFLASLAVLFAADVPSQTAAPLFVLDGLIAVAAVMFTYEGILRLGPSSAIAIKNAAPLVAVVGATVALGERPAAGVYAGAVLVVTGTVALAYDSTNGRIGLRAGLAFPAAAAILFAVDSLVRRTAVQQVESPLFGAVIAQVVGLLLAGAWLVASRSRLPDRRSAALLIGSGICQGAAICALLFALQDGSVSVVVPLYQSSPVFVLLGSAVIFRSMERLTARIVAGVLLATGGVALISISAH